MWHENFLFNFAAFVDLSDLMPGWRYVHRTHLTLVSIIIQYAKIEKYEYQIQEYVEVQNESKCILSDCAVL